MSPTTYSPPVVGPSGFVSPSYTAILNNLIGGFLALYGANVYLGLDSSDFQWLAVLALQATDFDQALQAVYLSFNPQTAIGASLDLLGVLIGTARDGASFSQVALTVTGVAGTVINNGQAQDTNGNFWNIPGQQIIPSGGVLVVTAIAAQAGAISAQPGQVTTIQTPTAGWTSVTNAGPSTVGAPVEPDSHYRARLMISQAKPSLSLRAGTAAAVAAVPNVTRSVVYQNQYKFTASYGMVNTSGTSVTLLVGYPFDSSMAAQSITISGVVYTVASVSGATSLTLTASAGSQTGASFFVGDGVALGPEHSITTVVEGGTATAICQAIYNNHNPGCDINGTTSVLVADPNNGMIELSVSYDILGYNIIYVGLNIHGLVGYTSATTAAIQTAGVDYLNARSIGDTVVWSEVIAAAAGVNSNPEQPLFSIRSDSIIGQIEAATTATLNSTTSISVTSATGIANGQTVVGTGIPPNTTVAGVSGTTITLSASATATATGVAVSFFATGTSDIPIAYNQAPGGETANTVVTAV